MDDRCAAPEAEASEEDEADEAVPVFAYGGEASPSHDLAIYEAIRSVHDAVANPHIAPDAGPVASEIDVRGRELLDGTIESECLVRGRRRGRVELGGSSLAHSAQDMIVEPLIRDRGGDEVPDDCADLKQQPAGVARGVSRGEGPAFDVLIPLEIVVHRLAAHQEVGHAGDVRNGVRAGNGLLPLRN